MKKKVKYMILSLLAVMICAAAYVSVPIIKDGYSMYKQAVTETPLEERIEEIRSREDYVKFDDISEEFTSELIRSEDRRFYRHGALDFIAVCRATLANIVSGHIVQGGSTITQQLAKNMYFSFDKVYERKVAELLVAVELERLLTKDEILELYCNIVYFGQDCYGIAQASDHFFGTLPQDLSQRQSELLVHSLKAPSVYNPEARGIVLDSTLCFDEGIYNLTGILLGA